jgi:arginase family enzyme
MLRGWITSMDVVEYVPKRDVDGKTGKFAARIIDELLK